MVSQAHPRPTPALGEEGWRDSELAPYLVPHVQHFLGVGIERHKLVWVFDPYWHATAGFLHLVGLHPLNTHKARRVSKEEGPRVLPSGRPHGIGAHRPTRMVSKPLHTCDLPSVTSVSQSRRAKKAPGQEPSRTRKSRGQPLGNQR